MMIVILRIVIGVFATDCIGRIRQQTRGGEQPLIDRVEIDKRFQCRSTTARLRSAVDLGHGVVLRPSHGANCTGGVFDNDHRSLPDIVPIQRR